MPFTDTQSLSLTLRTSSDRRLVEWVRDEQPEVAAASLGELLRRDPAGAADVATELLLGRGPDRVRACAALVLAHSDRDVSRLVLRRALDSPNPELVRRVCHALGRIGAPQDLPGLATLAAVPTSSLAKEARMARTLICYRHGLDDVLVSAPRLVEGLSGRVEPIGIGVRVPGTKDRLVAAAAFEVPTATFGPTTVHSLRSGGRIGALALTTTVTEGLDRAACSRPRLLGAVLRAGEVRATRGRRPVLTLAAWLLMDDRDHTGGHRPRLWVVRPDGAVTHAGRALVGPQGLTFVIDRAAGQARSVRLSGRVEGGRVSFTEGLLGGLAPPLARPVAAVAEAARWAS